MSSQNVPREGTESLVLVRFIWHARREAVRWGALGSAPTSPLDLDLRYTDQGGEEEEDHESEEQLQHRILTAALEFVPAHGWTAEAIAEGAQVCIGEGGAAWLWSTRRASCQPKQRAAHTFQPCLEPLTAAGLSVWVFLRACVCVSNEVEIASFINFFHIKRIWDGVGS